MIIDLYNKGQYNINYTEPFVEATLLDGRL